MDCQKIISDVLNTRPELLKDFETLARVVQQQISMEALVRSDGIGEAARSAYLRGGTQLESELLSAEVAIRVSEK